MLYLDSEDAPSRVILNATADGFSRTFFHETEGVAFAADDCTPEKVAEHFAEISDPTGQHLYEVGGEQVIQFVTKAAAVA